MKQSEQEAEKQLRARNVRTAIVMASIATLLFVAIIVRTWYTR